MKKHPPPHRTPQRLSLVAQTVQIVRESIQHGRWRDHLPGERELSAELQVSRDTLRAALEELRREGWIESAGRFRHRITARKVKRGPREPRPVLGILSPSPFSEIEMPTTAIMDQLRVRLGTLGVEVEFHASRACFSERPDAALKKLTRDHPAAAWVILGSREPMQHWFLRQGVPCLVLGSCGLPDQLGSIDTDHRAIGRHAGALLLRQGHRRIALIMTRSRYGGELDCETGLREMLSSTPDAQLEVLHHDDHPDHLRQLLEKALSSPSPPSACIVTNHRAILTVTTHLLRKGFRIPREMALILGGSSPAVGWITPALSHYTIPVPLFVRHAIHAARSLLEHPAVQPRTIRLMPEFVRGETT